jgi:glycosyltransferase involved in cell wall biosynthesis
VKVMVANKYFFPNGGSETVMFDERAFLLRSGMEVVDFSMEHPLNVPSPYRRHFIRHRDYRSGGAFTRMRRAVSLVHSREAVRKLHALIDEARPDLLHCHNIYHQLTPSIIGAAKSRGVPVVLTLHDSKPICPIYTRMRAGQLCSLCINGDFSHVVRNRCADGSIFSSVTLYAEAVVQRWLASYEKVDRFLAPSQFIRHAVLNRFAPEKVLLLHNGVDTGNLLPSERDEGYVLYCGRLAAKKGVETLLWAHQAIDCPWPVVIAGTGPLERALRSRFTRNVRFVGHLSGPALRATMQNASILVAPSELPENCPMSVLEAMAYGKATIGTRTGGLPELIAEGVTGLLFDPKDTDALASRMSVLMADPTMRRSMGRAARQRAEREFSRDKHNGDLLKIYTSVIYNQKKTGEA